MIEIKQVVKRNHQKKINKKINKKEIRHQKSTKKKAAPKKSTKKKAAPKKSTKKKAAPKKSTKKKPAAPKKKDLRKMSKAEIKTYLNSLNRYAKDISNYDLFMMGLGPNWWHY